MPRRDIRPREGGGIDVYRSQIRTDALLSAAVESELAGRIAAGDDSARALMIRANLRLVVKIARGYTGRGLALDDLVGEGNLGLIRAVDQFNPRFGTRFSTYASYWIKQGIRHALSNATATIRLPAHMTATLTRWRRAERDLGSALGRPPDFDEVAAHLKLTESQRELVARARQASRIHQEGTGEDDSDRSVEQTSDGRESPDAALERAEERRRLSILMQTLDDRERTVVTLRFGLDGEAPMTFREVGRRLGITSEWARKIALRAVRKLDQVRPTSGRVDARRPRHPRELPATNAS